MLVTGCYSKFRFVQELRKYSSTSTEEKRKQFLKKMAYCAQWLPARYVFAILGFTGITMQYVMKTNLSVAIVGMAKSNSTSSYTEEDSCPAPDSSSSESTESEGEFEWDTTQQGLLLSSYFYGYVTTQLLGGYLAQRFGGRLVMGPGIALTGVLTLLTEVVARASFTGLIILRILEGAASGVVLPSMQSMFSRWYPVQERQRLSGFVFTSVYFGSLIGMSLSGWLYDLGGWPLVFYVPGVLAIVWFIPWILLAYDSPQSHPRITLEERDYIVNGLGQDPSTQPKVVNGVPWIRIILSPAIWAGILMQTGLGYVAYTTLTELPTYLNTILHIDVNHSGLLSSIPQLCSWISGNINGFMSQWIRKKGYMSHLTTYKVFNGIACIGTALCFLVITLVECDSVATIISFSLSMFFTAFIYGGSFLNHIDLAPNHTGSISGILHTVLNSTGFICPLVVSAVLDGQSTIDRWKIVFYINMGVLFGVYLFYLIFGSVTERSWNSWGVEHDEENSEKRAEEDKNRNIK